MLTVELVRRGAARHTGRTAVRSGDQSLTFTEVDEAANRIAHVLAGLGVARGMRVGLLINNGIWSIPVDFGCLKAGAARVPLNARLAADEQARMLAATGVRLLVHSTALADRAGELAAQVDGLRLASLGSAPDVDALDLLQEMGQASAADPRTPASASDPVLVLYTSGTTGALKAVEHTQASFAAITANPRARCGSSSASGGTAPSPTLAPPTTAPAPSPTPAQTTSSGSGKG
jgi:acyl-CoA synthetase (AMP-forming)/AMP-acid ligase II